MFLIILAPERPTSPSFGRKSGANEENVGESEQREDLRAVLGDAAITQLAIA